MVLYPAQGTLGPGYQATSGGTPSGGPGPSSSTAAFLRLKTEIHRPGSSPGPPQGSPAVILYPAQGALGTRPPLGIPQRGGPGVGPLPSPGCPEPRVPGHLQRGPPPEGGPGGRPLPGRGVPRAGYRGHLRGGPPPGTRPSWRPRGLNSTLWTQ